MNDIEADRSNISYVMSKEDLIKEAKRIKKEKKIELKRLKKQEELDKIAEEKFALINNLMLRYKT